MNVPLIIKWVDKGGGVLISKTPPFDLSIKQERDVVYLASISLGKEGVGYGANFYREQHTKTLIEAKIFVRESLTHLPEDIDHALLDLAHEIYKLKVLEEAIFPHIYSGEGSPSLVVREEQ